MELLDRTHEIRAIDSLLEHARQEVGGALVLRGEPGVGLTTLLDYAADAAPDMSVLRVVGVDAELQVAYGALHRLLAPEVWWRHNLHLPMPQRVALERAFGLDGHPAPLTTGPDTLAVGLGTLSLLARAAEERPVLCTVDNAEQVDEPSAAALALAARRLGADRIAMLFARRDPSEGRDYISDLEALVVGGLEAADARSLIDSVFGHRLDGPLRERILVETAGNPRAIVDLPSVLPPVPHADSVGPLPLGERLRDEFARRLRALSPAARDTILLAATVQDESAARFWHAADRLGLGLDASREAENAGLLRVGALVTLASPLLRSAVYGLATPEDRRRVHAAVADAADEAGDDVRHAWHRAAAAAAPSEEVAAALATAAGMVRRAGNGAGAALMLERAAALTPDPGTRAVRLLAGAEDRLATGAAGRSSALLADAALLNLEGLPAARAAMLRGRLAQSLGQPAEGAALMLVAAAEIAELDEELGRTAHLEALEAAVYGSRFGSGGAVVAAATAALRYPARAGAPAADLLLRGLAVLFTSGHAAATPTLRRALAALDAGTDPRWVALGGLTALELWDDVGFRAMASAVGRVGEASALAPVSLSLTYLAGLDHLITGRFTRAADHYADARILADAARDAAIAGIADAGSLLVHAWRGTDDARPMIDRIARDALAMERGRFYALTRYASAVIENAYGNYGAALVAAEETVEDRGLYLATFALPELVEAAVRIGDRTVALGALELLEARTVPSGTEWALGMLARSRALVADTKAAEPLYREAVDRLVNTRAVPQLARAHLLYGEWLRRRRRRRDAQQQLRRAEGMFVAMSAEAYAARAQSELEATGMQPHPRPAQPADGLTPQEARIATLVADGSSNPEIAAKLFISPRTVEYHLSKVFRKLGVSSRVELARTMIASQTADTER
jgi:DNA-binding CsgD family transcriptional regulator